MERAAELGRHMGDEPGLAAAGRPLQQQGQVMVIGVDEQVAFVPGRLVIGLTVIGGEGFRVQAVGHDDRISW